MPADRFDRLWRAHRGLVWSVVNRRFVRDEDREDAYQEAALRAWRGFATWDQSKPFAAWLAAVADHACLDLARYRRQAKRDSSRDLPLDHADRRAAARWFALTA